MSKYPRIGKAVLVLFLVCASGSVSVAQDDPFLLEDLPDHVIATMESRDQVLASLPQGDDLGFSFFVDDLLRWLPGQTVRVAFKGGSDLLHREIADATSQITGACNIRLDFGLNPATGKYRTWTTSDVIHSAEIRVSFDQKGNFSLVGTDSTNIAIGDAGQPVGGRANQRSLNLGGFDVARPASWRRTVRHEFLHALGFNHEHQSPVGGCDAQFRWENDPDYSFTQDPAGQFVPDDQGRRPGIYTYLSGTPNHWGKQKVDRNLRQAAVNSGRAGTFDRASIMLYRFPAHFYVSTESACAPIGNGEDLSQGDIAGLRLLYPRERGAVEDLARRQERLIDTIAKTTKIDASFKVLQAVRPDLQRGGVSRDRMAP